MKKSVQNKLAVTKRKVLKEWSKYRTVKRHILGLKRMPLDLKRGLLAEQREIAKANITAQYEDYRSAKYSLLHKSDVSGFSFVNKSVTTNTIQKTYKAQKGIGEKLFDKIISQQLEKEKVSGILAIIKVKNEDTGQVQYISDFISKRKLKDLQDQGKSVYEHIAGHARGLKSLQEFKELGIYMKVIYAKA